MQHRLFIFFKTHKIFIEKSLLIGILTLGFFLRIYNLTSVPYGFRSDEAAIGYNAYTLLHNGTDEYGISFPVFFKSFGEYKSPIQIYSTMPFVALFGLNEFSTRLTSVVYGVASLFAIYLLTKELFKANKQKKEIAFFSIFFLAISPWHIQFSRIAFEHMPFIFFTTFGTYLFLKAQKISKLLPLAVAFLVIALYSYYAGRIFIPLFLTGIFIVYFKFFYAHKKETAISFFLLIIILIPFGMSLLSQEGIARWKQTDIFDHPPQKLTTLQQIEVNYLSHFSPYFLFINGENAIPGNHELFDSINGLGELYFFQFPLVLYGIFILIKTRKANQNTYYLLLLWLLLYPTGGMFTVDTPLARRSIVGVIPFQILSAIGIIYLFDYLRKIKRIYAVITVSFTGIIILFSVLYYIQLYFIEYPKYSSSWWGWQYGPKDIVAYFTVHEKQYDDLVMAPFFNGPEEYFKFYSPQNCIKCKVGMPENFYNSQRKQLYALPPEYIKYHKEYSYSFLKTLYYPDNTPAFVLTEVKKI